MSHKFGWFVRSALLLGGTLSALSCSSPDAPAEVSRVSSAISGGQPDSVDSNVFLLVSHRGQSGVALCSASLIAPNLLLTARHCVSDVTEEHVTCGQTMASSPFPVSTFYATNSQSIDVAGPAYRISSVSVPTEGSDICGYDIALLTLTTSVPANVATPLVPRIDRPVSSRELYSAIGYGLDTPGDGGVAGRRRTRAGLEVSCIPGKCGTGVEGNEFVGDTGICSGDSGGPALDDAGKVVGVVSRSGNDCAHPVYGSVASWKDWISQVAEQAAAQGGYSAPFWVESGVSDLPPDAVGSAGASSTGASGAQGGNQCNSAKDCRAGFACYSPTSSQGDGHCAALCSDQAPCASGSTCTAVAGGQVCTAKPKPDDASSCSVATLGAANRNAAAAFALVALALLGWKRRPRGGRGAFRVIEGS